ncbi:MAG TPA: hypothetical protein DCK93_05305 [Blastocatellia bacterium]|nr:hypothetical protein [Blastocatellia bacterium]HAF22319.1 hypothetical protein [Blastocatellia bacterium]
MTIAWYGHLKIGSNYFSFTQLKIIQECITLLVFREPRTR